MPYADSRSWEERALAAERTVEVLKAKVRDLYDGAGSTIEHQLQRAKKRQEEIRRKQELMAVRNAELEKYSQTLEAEVAARTRAIKTIVDNVTFGFLIVGPDLVVQPGCTKSCASLFGTDLLAGRPLLDLLGLTAEKERAEYELNVEQLFEDMLPDALTIEQLRKRFELESGRILQVEPRVIRNDAGALESLLMTVSDITALESAQHEALENKMLLSLLKRRDAFRDFLLDAKHQLEHAHEALSKENEDIARRAVHTVKGNAAVHGLTTVASQIHEVENAPHLCDCDVGAVEDALRSFLKQHEAVLELSFDELQSNSVEVRARDLNQLRRISDEVSGQPGEELRRWLKLILLQPATAVMGPIEESVQRLAALLEKRVRLHVEGADTMVDPELVRPIFQGLTHILRNAIDHGLEAPQERGTKPEDGLISFKVNDSGDSLTIEIADDGRGINVDRVVARAVQRGLFSPEAISDLSEKDKLRLIFADGLSTAETTTEVSGRGVGMSAVASEVERLGGWVDVMTSPGQGTTVRITIPKADERVAAAQ